MSPKFRQAASVVLRRGNDPRVYLAQRNPKLRFFGGFWAFPGGAVDRVDHAAADLVVGAADDEAPFFVCAAREALEELGLKLWSGDGAEVDRAAVVESAAQFAPALQEAGCTIPGKRFPSLIRLLTPSFLPIRFDTSFVVIDLESWPEAGEPIIVEGELVDGRWDTPAQWLSEWRSGGLLIPPPVVLMLKILEEYGFDGCMEPLAALEAGFARGRLHPIWFNPAVQLLPLRTPTLPPATHTNAYLVGSGPVYLFDPASPHADVQDRLLDALEEARDEGRPLTAIVLTHHHPDHVGAVERVRQELGVPVWAHRVTAELLAGTIEVDRLLEDGETLPIGRSPDGHEGWELEVLFTPGHAAGHLCFLERRHGSLICGDMMSTLSSILVHPDDGDMGEYMDSLERLASISDIRMVFPAHGPATEAGVEALQRQLEHRRHRRRQVEEAMAGGATEAAAIVTQVYGDLDPRMLPYAAASVRSVQLQIEAEAEAAAGDGG